MVHSGLGNQGAEREDGGTLPVPLADVSDGAGSQPVIRFRLTNEDAAEMTLAAWERDPSVRHQLTGFWKNRIVASFYPISVMIALFYFLRSLGDVGYSVEWWELLIAGVLVVTLIQQSAIAVKLLRFRPKSNLREQAYKAVEQAMSYDLGEQTLELGSDFFIWTSRHEVLRQRWAGIRRVVVEQIGMLIERGDGRSFIVPRNQLGDAGFDSLVAAVRAAHAKTGSGPDRIVEAYLRSFPTPCPACKYLLKGISRAECPECGVQLNRYNLPAAWFHAVENIS